MVVERLDPHRGPDVRVCTSVPHGWLLQRANVRVVLPRLAACVACDGGGCERCAGKGALPLRGVNDAPLDVEVHLHPVNAGQTLVLRLPELGPESSTGGPRGCVLLEVSTHEVASPNVSLVTVVTHPTGFSWQPWAALAVALTVLLLVALLLM